MSDKLKQLRTLVALAGYDPIDEIMFGFEVAPDLMREVLLDIGWFKQISRERKLGGQYSSMSIRNITRASEVSINRNPRNMSYHVEIKKDGKTTIWEIKDEELWG